MAQNVSIEVDDKVKLAGELDEAGWEWAACVLHPHPLYGGSMHNNVVAALRGGAAAAGATALAFNFRGVGGSSGSHGHGNAEVDDVLAALGWLRAKGAKNLAILGYSFGAMVGARAANRAAELGAALWVAPPLILGPMPPHQAQAPLAVVAGGRDEFADPDGVTAWARGQGALADFHMLETADHFFLGRESELSEIVTNFLSGLTKREMV